MGRRIWVKDDLILSDLRVHRQIWIEEDLIWVVWGWNARDNCQGLELCDLRVQVHIRFDEDMIGMYKGTFETRKGYLSSKGYDLSGSRVQMHIWEQEGSLSSKGFDLNGMRVWLEWVFEYKMASLEGEGINVIDDSMERT